MINPQMIYEAVKFGATTAKSGTKEAIANTSMVTGLKNQARNWAARVVALHNRKVPPQYQAEKESLLRRAKTIKDAVEKIFGNVPELNVVGLAAVPFLAVGVAAVSAVAALLTKWTYDYLTLSKKLDEYDKIVATGVPRGEAKSLVNDLFDKAAEQTTLGKAVSALPLIAAAGIGIYLLTQNSKGK